MSTTQSRLAAIRRAALATPALSDLHAMLLTIERQTDVKRFNEILNDPSIRPWVSPRTDKEAIDVTAAFEAAHMTVLLGAHGGFMFGLTQPGIYEAHSQVLPSGRGKWALLCAKACLHWMFTKTDCVEVMMRCPKGNLAVHALARALKATYRFTNPQGWIKDGEPIPADIYSLTIEDWVMDAPGLVERGIWFHKRLEAAKASNLRGIATHPDDCVHDRYVGAALEMLLAGQPGKAVAYYNRWAAVAFYAPVHVASLNPLTVRVGSLIIEVSGDDITIIPGPEAVH